MKTASKRVAAATATWTAPRVLLAVCMLPMAAVAAEGNADVAALTQPASSVEVGAENVSASSDKFGEYNGLNKSGVDVLGNFSLRGGDGYQGYEGGSGITRWAVTGSDLGTTSRTLDATVSNQGHWNLGLGYDELHHYYTESYQTPFAGSIGANSFFLPDTFGVIASTLGGPAGTGTQALTANQLSFFHNENVYSGRQNLNFTAGYDLGREWSAQFNYNRLDQSGAKLIGGSFAPDASGAGGGEDSATFMNPTRYKTDTFEFALNRVSDRWHLRASYFASLFTDDYSSVSFSNPFVDSAAAPAVNGTPPVGGVFPVDTYATPPNNNFQQLDLSGGYAISPNTSLAGGLSYGRNTQNSGFINDPLFDSVLPRSSLDGLVVTTHADLKLTSQTTKDLTLSAGLKFNERNNRTPSETFGQFLSIAGDQWGSVVNTPVSNKKTELELAGNYRLDSKQSFRLAYDYDAISRWCHNALANNAQSSDPTAPAGYYTMAACVEVPDSRESKFSASYKLRAADRVRFHAGYSYADRHVDINSSYYNPMQTSGEGFQNFGYVPYFDADRTEQVGKAGIDWEANDKVDVGLDGRYVRDQYGSALGVQTAHTWVANLDAAYHYSAQGNVGAYLTVQGRQRDLLSGAEPSPLAPPPSLWSNRLKDDSDTIGLTARQKGLLHDKLEVVGDFSYSSDRSVYSTSLVNYTSVLCTPYGITCGTLPTIKNDSLRLKLTAIYQASASNKFALHYLYAKLSSADYYYSAYQLGSTDVVVLPTNQAVPSYSVSVVGISYIHTFR
jgi:MtrB/PioB family decaheme-associated outer membrane protein